MGQLFALSRQKIQYFRGSDMYFTGSALLSLLCIAVESYLLPPQPIPMIGIPMQPMQAIPSMPYGGTVQARPCPMSPYAKFLSEQEQQSLAELVTEARGQGADEPTVQQHIMKYVGTVLSPQRFSEFQRANEDFEQQRRGKRDLNKQKPQKIFDFLDEYNGHSGNGQYAKMYEENTRKLRLH